MVRQPGATVRKVGGPIVYSVYILDNCAANH